MLARIALRGKDRRSTWRCHRAYVASEAEAGRSAVIATMAANAVIAIAERVRDQKLPDVIVSSLCASAHFSPAGVCRLGAFSGAGAGGHESTLGANLAKVKQP